MSARKRPVPALAERLLAILLPSAMRDQILADLAELASRSDRVRPYRWYWGQTLRALWPPTLIAMYVESTRFEAAWPSAGNGGSAANFFEGLLTDIRRSTRGLVRRPAFAATAIGTLAIGIGATTAMFSVAHGVALRPLPYDSPDRLFAICERSATTPPTACVLSPPNAEDLKRRIPGIEYLGVGRRWGVKLGSGDNAETLLGAVLTPDVFRAFQLRAVRGRLLEEADLIGRPSAVAVISHAFWRTHFGERDVIGRPITLDGEPVIVVGILPPNVELPRLEEVAVWRPLPFDPRDETNRNWAGFHSYGRVRIGQSFEKVAREIATVAPTLRREYFARREGWNLGLVSLTDLVLGRSRYLLLVFLGGVALLLVVACANVANLMLAQSTARQQEWGIRTALGASPERLVTLQLTESFLLAFVGALAGLGIAVGGVRAFKHFAPPGLPRIEEVGIDATVLGFVMLIAALTAVSFGVGPAVRAVRANVSTMLGRGGRTFTRGVGRLSSTLVVIEIALAMTLVAGAGLLSRSFAAMAAWQPGFDARRISIFSLSVSTDRYREREQLASLWSSVERELRSIPGVEAVTSASAGPLFGGGDGSIEFLIDGVEKPRPAAWFDVGPGFFRTVGIPVVRGRELAPEDRGDGPRAVVVNQTFVRRYLPSLDAIGRRALYHGGKDTATIVGVVRDVPPLAPELPVEPQIYWSNRQAPRYFTYIILRTTDPDARASTLTASIRDRLRRVDRELRPSTLETIAASEQEELRRPLFNMFLSATFALTAMVLAGVGTYALLAYYVSQRNREMGIRLALGAQPRQVATMIVRGALKLTLAGLVIGLVGANLTGRSVASLVHGVSPRDGATFAAAGIALALVALAASVIPAWRASRVPPAVTLVVE